MPWTLWAKESSGKKQLTSRLAKRVVVFNLVKMIRARKPLFRFLDHGSENGGLSPRPGFMFQQCYVPLEHDDRKKDKTGRQVTKAKDGLL